MEPFRIHIADDVLNDLRARLRNARWPDQIPDIGWKKGPELNWLRPLVSYWAHEFDWRVWERRLNTFNHYIWEGVHFVCQRAASETNSSLAPISAGTMSSSVAVQTRSASRPAE